VAIVEQVHYLHSSGQVAGGQIAGGQKRQSVSRHQADAVPMGTISLCASALGIGALIVVVQARGSAVSGLPSALMMLLLGVAVAGLVFGALTGIVSLARPSGPGGRSSGVAAAGLLLLAWLMALGLELVALLSTPGPASAVDQASQGATTVIVMAGIVLVAGVTMTGAIVHRVRATAGPSRGMQHGMRRR